MSFALKAKRSKPYFLSLLLFVASAAVFASAHVEAPSSPKLIFYSTEAGDDLAQVVYGQLARAKRSIYLRAFTLQAHIADLLEKKRRGGLDIDAASDGRYSYSLPDSFKQISSGGLHHHKILITDHSEVLFGSANFTKDGLNYQANLLAACRDPDLAAFLIQDEASIYAGSDYTLYRLPSPKALEALIEAIDSAKTSIDLALFSLTHKKLIERLIDAQERGVHVRLVVDSTSARHIRGIERWYTWRGGSFMHHKYALIDNSTLIFGSANWTKSAFEKNRDLLVIGQAPQNMAQLFEKLLQKSLGKQSTQPLK